MSRAQPLVSENPTTDDLCLKLAQAVNLVSVLTLYRLISATAFVVTPPVDDLHLAFGSGSGFNKC